MDTIIANVILILLKKVGLGGFSKTIKTEIIIPQPNGEILIKVTASDVKFNIEKIK